MLQVQNAIPFNRAPVTGRELELIRQALESRHLAGDGPHTQWCHAHLKEQLGVHSVLLTTSCTMALELAGLLCGLQPGDEVIMPSFTFVSTANAVVLRGAKPVFVDARPDTLNIDETLIEAAITPRTRAIFPVHYAAVTAEMDAINAIAARHGLMVVEDAAQSVGARYKGRPAGSLGDMGCFSFHETKNVVSGEGGAIALRDATLADRARILWEKGTNRTAFRLGQVDKYTWVDVGSSFLPSELTAAVLRAQLEGAQGLIDDRLQTWRFYHAALEDAEGAGLLRRPIVPAHCEHNGHIYYVLCADRAQRDAMIGRFRAEGITATFHYIPLHSAPAGQRHGITHGDLRVTDDIAARLLRLPLWYGMGNEAARVIEILRREPGLASL
jgi:dTDP-4-amino-4,6-dideoxygalactose transaminase